MAKLDSIQSQVSEARWARGVLNSAILSSLECLGLGYQRLLDIPVECGNENFDRLALRVIEDLRGWHLQKRAIEQDLHQFQNRSIAILSEIRTKLGIRS
jgi:hypothetical protein